MAILIAVEDSDPPEVMCSECDVVFHIYWHRNAWTKGLSYCPFCGAEIEDAT